MTEKYYTAAAAARVSGMGLSTILRRLYLPDSAEGKLRADKLPGATNWRIPHSELERLFAIDPLETIEPLMDVDELKAIIAAAEANALEGETDE